MSAVDPNIGSAFSKPDGTEPAAAPLGKCSKANFNLRGALKTPEAKKMTDIYKFKPVFFVPYGDL